MALPPVPEPSGARVIPANAVLADLVEYRGATEEDVHFIKKTWMRSHRQAVTNLCESKTFFPKMEMRIGRIAERAECVIACDKEQPFYIYGWLVGSGTTTGELILHYAYVREEWRNMNCALGMAKHLGYKEGKQIIATHEPRLLNQRRVSQRHVTIDPFLLEEMLVKNP